MEEPEGDTSSAYDQSNMPEDSLMTPFAGDAISNILSDIKPFRNVIKRYWTDDEVNISVTKFSYLCYRIRNCALWLTNTG